MKRLLTLLLVVLVCLGCMTLVACGNNNDNNTDTDTGSTPAGPSNLDNAIEYVFSMYNSGLGDEAAKLEKDLTVIASVIVEKDSFNVEWLVEVTKGAADAVKVVDGANNTKTIDIPDYNDEQIEFTLKATVKGADGKTGDVSFKYYIPVRVKQEIDSAKKIVLQFKDGDTTKYITGKHYLYTSSSGSQKWELELTEVLAEALAITVVENDDNTVSFVAEGKYLFCDATNVKFVDTQDDNTKFVLEPTSNGVFIKCAVANFNGKAQYLEVYKGYLTCYSMNESSDPAIFTFSFVDADNTVAGTIVIPDNTDKPGSGDDTTGGDNTGDEVVDTNPSYIFGMTQANCDNKIYYLAGGMNGYYMETTEDKDAALKVYLEATDGGYYFYCYVGSTKTYINMVVSGEHVNGAYEATASTVYTLDAEKNTLIATVNDAPYWFGTRNDKTYTTMGPCKTEYEGFYGVLYPTTAEDDDTTGGDNTGDDNTGDVIPEKIVIEFVDGDTTKYITGKHYLYTSSSGSEKWELELTENLADALAITVQKNDDNTISFVAEGKYLFCNGTDVKFVDTQDDNTKFVIEDSTNGKFIKCAVANFNGKAQYLEVYSGYLTCYSMNESKANIYTFSLVEADESAAGTIVIPEPHVCTVFNDATCTTPKTCTECGATVGSALGHSYANGVCSVCGANEPTVDGTSVTASKTVADLITEYGWTNSTTKQSFNLDDNVSVKVNGGSNSGKAYNGDHIRIYATDSPAGTLTISVADGYELVSVKVTTLTGTYAFLYVDGSTTDISNQSVEVSGTSVVLNTVMNGTDGKQVRVTAIEVVYKEA
ncbi:MAG: hypothetical protein J6A53_01335 [Clostridia bacterium]|nr:hypothetical protein [Clostridia bacterium]